MGDEEYPREVAGDTTRLQRDLEVAVGVLGSSRQRVQRTTNPVQEVVRLVAEQPFSEGRVASGERDAFVRGCECSGQVSLEVAPGHETPAGCDAQPEVLGAVGLRDGAWQEWIGFQFVLLEGSLVWNARSDDPLWVIAGEAYRTLIKRLANATADEFGNIESEFTSGLRQDMSNDERERIQGWIAALRSAGQLFEPASSESICGFPLRATLRKAAAKPMTFHLLTMPGSPANLVYVQEREVQVADIETLWSRRRSDQPWRVWSEITGSPPRMR